jgi:transposase
VREVRPEQCACGNTTFPLTTPYHTHQVLELPPITMEVTHWVLHQGWCPDCGRWSKAQVPTVHATGYGPRFSALMGEVAGAYGNGRRLVQTFCASVLHVPISLGGPFRRSSTGCPRPSSRTTRRLPRRRDARWSTTLMRRPGF